MDIVNDISTENFKNYHYSSALINMINGLEKMILSAPKSEKKEMLVDTLHYAKEVAQRVKNNANGISFLLTENHRLELIILDYELKSIKDKLRIKILEAHLEAALPMDEFENKIKDLK